MKKYLKLYKRYINETGGIDLDDSYKTQAESINKYENSPAFTMRFNFFSNASYFWLYHLDNSIESIIKNKDYSGFIESYLLIATMTEKILEFNSKTFSFGKHGRINTQILYHYFYLRVFFNISEKEDLDKYPIIFANTYSIREDENKYLELILNAYFDESKIQKLCDYFKCEESELLENSFKRFADSEFPGGADLFVPYSVLAMMGLLRKYNKPFHFKNVVLEPFVEFEHPVKLFPPTDKFIIDFAKYLDGVEFVKENDECIDIKFHNKFGEEK